MFKTYFESVRKDSTIVRAGKRSMKTGRSIYQAVVPSYHTQHNDPLQRRSTMFHDMTIQAIKSVSDENYFYFPIFI